MIRKPGIFERALILSDAHAPFNVVSVLKLENPPEPGVVLSELEMLQKRHPFLRARIQAGIFESLPQPGIAFSVIKRENDLQWQETVETEM
ncbi:MAG TPA: hypothetical protein VFM46_17700, partial [Pseudomonadales bacterium]|nr:hypothetical protein [Pseudomonadales bacterium]